jgi:imidazolonepropionase-like amidohydrolase
MRRAFVLLPGLFVGAALAGTGSLRAQAGTWALTNARIQTVTNGVIERGTIVVRNGLIEAVGASVPIPPDARVLDLAGRTVTPGLLDLASTIGAGSTPAQGAGQRPPGTPATPAPGSGRPEGLDPSRVIAAELRLNPADLKVARDAGIAAILAAPTRGAFRGVSALVPTRDSAGQPHVIRAPLAIQMGFQGAPGGYPATLLGVIAYERQTLYDAQRYALLADRYRATPRGMTRPEFDPGLEALAPAVRGDLPVFFDAGGENEIRRAARIAREFNLKMTVVGATEGWRATDALAGRSAIVSVNFPKAPEVTGWSYRLSSRMPPDSAAADSAATPLIEGNAAALHRAGVRFALGSGGAKPPDFLANVRKAVAAGLPAGVALEALTIRAAEIAGMEQALGSIEAGKIANLVVTEKGDLLADSAKVRHVFVDGIHYAVDPPAPPSPRAGGGGRDAPARIDGSWTMTVTSPQGPMEIAMTIAQSGTSFTGSMTSMMGTTPFDDGQVNGSSASWSMTVQMGPQSMTLTFRGEVEGTRMTGTVLMGEFGTAPFTAEKRP